MALKADLTRLRQLSDEYAAGQDWQALWQTADNSHFPGALIPVRQNGAMHLYAVVQDARSWRMLRPLLLAFCGPTVSSFSGLPCDLDVADPIEKEIADLGPHVVALLRPGAFPQGERWLRVSAIRMVERFVASPELAQTQKKTTAKLLTSIQESLNGGDFFAARSTFEVLDSEHRLDAFNLAQLDIKILAVALRWADIRFHHQFDTIRLGGPTPATAEALLTAIYHCDVLAEEEGSAAPTNAETWNREIAALVEPLLALVPHSSRGVIGDLKRLAALNSTDVPNAAPVNSQVVVTEDAPVRSDSAGPEPVKFAQNALISYIGLSDGEQTDGHKRRVWDAVVALNANDRDQLLSNTYFNIVWNDLCAGQGQQSPPRSWVDWILAIADPGFDAHLYLKSDRTDWQLPDESIDPLEVEKFVEAVEAIPDGLAATRLAQALPFISDWIENDPRNPRIEFAPLYQVLLTRMMLGAERGDETLNSANIVLDAALSVGLTVPQYKDVLDAAFEIGKESLSRRTALQVLSLAETVILNPQKDRDQFLAFGSRLLSEFKRFETYLSGAQRRALLETGRCFEIQFFEPEEIEPEQESLKDRLNGMTVGVYTLTESAGQKACEILQAFAPDAKFVLNSDHAGTTKLEALARNSDLFVMVSRSATHAAFDVIQKFRGDRPLVYASGKGTSSIVRAVEEWSDRKAN